MNKQCYSKPKVEDKIFGLTKIKALIEQRFASNFQNNLGSIEHMYGNIEDGKTDISISYSKGLCLTKQLIRNF